MNGNQCVICGAPMGEGNQVCKDCLKSISEPPRNIIKAKIINMLLEAVQENVAASNKVRNLTLKLAELECE